MPLISHTAKNGIIHQRATDGYINATAMCKAAGKRFGHYNQIDSTSAFLRALEADVGIPSSELVQVIRGGRPELQGTWVHPQVAINLAQWLSPKFAVQVSRWVFEWVSGQASHRPSGLPDHVRRYLINRSKIPPTHFSMLDQMTLRLLAPLEDHGYILPSELWPDISLGRMFSAWLREKGHNPATFPTYQHEFTDGRHPVEARLYPNELMTEFNQRLESWLRDGRARAYFGARDEDAIYPLDRVIALLPRAQKQLLPGR